MGFLIALGQDFEITAKPTRNARPTPWSGCRILKRRRKIAGVNE
jgi:hypothetical protein